MGLKAEHRVVLAAAPQPVRQEKAPTSPIRSAPHPLPIHLEQRARQAAEMAGTGLAYQTRILQGLLPIPRRAYLMDCS
jgi:hypothetical protein